MSTFEIIYRVTVQEGEQIDEKVEEMCLEQTAELPRGILDDDIQEEVVGKPVRKNELDDQRYEVVIAWPLADVGGDISQFLNILYGNISLQPGIQIVSAEWSALNSDVFEGPGLGISEIRKKYHKNDRPFSATALKPLGSTPDELADLTYEFALGGIDIIKDDHGLANQDFAPFEERVEACIAAVQRANEETNRRSYYYPNITAFASETVKRYKQAAELGADGALLCPHIAGLETMHRLARLDIDLPIIAHPAFSGGLTTHKDKGLTPDFLYGQLWRALGADFVIYPNKGGRFSLTSAECKAINNAARNGESPFKSSFPMPGGGIDRSNIPHWLETYGSDTVFLLGGSLYEHPDGPQSAAKELSEMLK